MLEKCIRLEVIDRFEEDKSNKKVELLFACKWIVFSADFSFPNRTQNKSYPFFPKE